VVETLDMATLSVPGRRSAAAFVPPLAGKAREPLDGEAPRGGRTLARTIARAWTEVRESFTRIDARRLLWSVGAVIPDFTFPCARARFLAIVGCEVPRGTGVLGHIDLIGPPGSASNLRIGTGSTICPHARFWLDGPITLGKNVTIGPNAMLCTATHPIGGPTRRMQINVAPRPIVIEDGAWIGLGAMILPGVRVGRGAIVGAGAVVRGDVPQNVIVAGNPAAIVRRLPVR
jgi:maltose O-acetyltransferase